MNYCNNNLDFFKQLLGKELKEEEIADAFIESLYLVDKRPLWTRLSLPYYAHRWMYDFDSLKNLLLSIGFTVVEKRSFREGVVPDLELLDNRPQESLYVEARK